jgi:hypothetical protein
MEKFENLITKVNFKNVGIFAFNRQQLAEITKKQLDEKIELRIGNEITILGTKLKIVELVFTLSDNVEPSNKSVNIFSTYDSSENNCVLTVFLKKTE